MLWCVNLLFAAAAGGQLLDLDVTPDPPDARPSLAILRERLTGELNELGTPRAGDPPETRAILTARRTMRRFILELAENGWNADDVSLASALAARRLAFSRKGFDQYLQCLEVGNAFTGSPPQS